MKNILVTALVVLSFGRLDHSQAKDLIRRWAARFCQAAFKITTPRYYLRRTASMVIAPHPDDESLGCGALIARKRSTGLPVDVVFLTDGNASHLGHPRVTAAELTAIRRQEARFALATLGVDSETIHFLGETDGALGTMPSARRTSLVNRLAALLVEVAPGEIFLPGKPDNSTEHEAAFALVIDAVRRSNLRPAVWQFPVWLWWNPFAVLRQVMRPGIRCYVPAEDFLEIKRSALASYRSQLEPLPPQQVAMLPRELVFAVTGDAELFFRFEIPPGDNPLASP